MLQWASAISLWHSSRYKTLILTIARKRYISVPSRGSCDPAEWTASHSRWRGDCDAVHSAGSQLPLRVLGMYLCRAPETTRRR